MSDLYSECIVKRKSPALAPLGKVGLILVTVILFLSSFTGILWWMVIPAALFGYLSYRIILNWDLEYEYIFVKGELDIDKIMGKSKRKRCLVIDLDHTEIMAPEGAYQLDTYKNNNCKSMDFSSGILEHKKYVIYATVNNEMVRLVFEPNERMIQDMKNTSPRKVIV